MSAAVVVAIGAGCSVPCVDDGLLSMQHDQSCAQQTTTATSGPTSSSTTLTTSTTTVTTTVDPTDTTTTGTSTGSGSTGGSTGDPVSCNNGEIDGDESDVDCGGDDCDPCEPGELCGGDADNCDSSACNGLLCIDPQACELPAGADLLPSAMDQLGVAVDVVGDVDGDGIDDIVAASWGAPPRVFVIYGDPDLADGFDLDALESGQGGFVIQGPPAIGAIAPAGDFNEDGIGDFALGDESFTVHIVYGRDDPPPVPPINLSDLVMNGQGVRFTGPGIGRSLAGGLDVDGDGKGDLVIGAPSPQTDTTYVVFSAPGLTDVEVKAAAGFQLTSSLTGAGQQVALLPDLDGDSLAEVVVAAPDAGNAGGRVHVVFGKADAAEINLDEASASFYTIGPFNQGELGFGATMAAAGDVDGDGLHDIIAGTNSTAVYVVFGKADDADIDVDALGTSGFKIVLADNNGFTSVGGGRDVNGDGRSDLFLGTPYATKETLWVVFGKDTPEDVLASDLEMNVGGFVIRLPDSDGDADFARSFDAGDPLGIGAATAVIGAPKFMVDEGLIKLVTLGLCPP